MFHKTKSFVSAINIQYFKTDFGELIIGEWNQRICLLDWQYRNRRVAIDQRIKKMLNAEFQTKNSEIIEQAKYQLIEYFKRERKEFDFPFQLVGTEFQKQVWAELIKIPYGKTITYLELANRLENPQAIRAVATANGANALAIVIPCHRVIGSNGQLVGYAGGLFIKKRLLELENNSMITQTLF